MTARHPVDGGAEGRGYDCRAAEGEAWELIDGECEESRRRRVQAHLEECPGCLERFLAEQRLRVLLGTKCCEKAPVGLAERLRARIAAVCDEQMRIEATVRTTKVTVTAVDGTSVTRVTRITHEITGGE